MDLQIFPVPDDRNYQRLWKVPRRSGGRRSSRPYEPTRAREEKEHLESLDSVVPWSDDFSGKERISNFEALFQSVDLDAFEPNEWIADGDVVVSLGEFWVPGPRHRQTFPHTMGRHRKFLTRRSFRTEQFHDPALATALRRVGRPRPLNKRGSYSCNRLARSALFITKTQQQCFKIIQCLLSIGPDRLDDDTSAAIQIGAKDFQYARRRETFLVLANRDLALELYYALNKLRRGPRV